MSKKSGNDNGTKDIDEGNMVGSIHRLFADRTPPPSPSYPKRIPARNVIKAITESPDTLDNCEAIIVIGFGDVENKNLSKEDTIFIASNLEPSEIYVHLDVAKLFQLGVLVPRGPEDDDDNELMELSVGEEDTDESGV